jgi:hypothetical protein
MGLSRAGRRVSTGGLIHVQGLDNLIPEIPGYVNFFQNMLLDGLIGIAIAGKQILATRTVRNMIVKVSELPVFQFPFNVLVQTLPDFTADLVCQVALHYPALR